VVVCSGALEKFVEGMVPKAAKTGDEIPFGVPGGDVEACSCESSDGEDVLKVPG